MDFNNIIRGFFGFRQPKRDSHDEDCSKCYPESTEDGRHSSIDTYFHDEPIFNIVQPLDPFNIFQQMEDAFSHFFSFHSGRMIDFPPLDGIHEDDQNNHDFFHSPFDRNYPRIFWGEPSHREFFEFPGSELPEQPTNPRDFVLKPSERDSQKSIMVRPGFQQDTDLDNTLQIDGNGNDLLKRFSEGPRRDTNMSWGKSVSIKTIRGADGTIEEHKTVRDSSGNEVTTVCKTIGDQSYTVTLHKDNEGLKEKKEDLINLDEKDIPQFEERWKSMKGSSHHTPRNDLLKDPSSAIQDVPGDPNYSSIFRKLFRF